MAATKTVTQEISNGAKIGSFLKYWRKQNHLSLGVFSKASGLTPSFLFRLEKGDYRSVKLDALEKIARSLKMSIEDFLYQCDIISSKNELPSLEYFLVEKYQFPPQAIEEIRLMIEFLQGKNGKEIAVSEKRRQEFRAQKLIKKEA